MDETSVFTALSGACAMMEVPTANADSTPQRRLAWVSGSISVSTRSRVPLRDQLANELRELAEPDPGDEPEGWPDDDWSDL